MNALLARAEFLIVAVICVGVVAVVALVGYQALASDTRPDPLDDILRDYAEDYTVPIAESQMGGAVCNEHVNPASGAQACAQLVGAVEESGAALERAIARTQEHVDRGRTELYGYLLTTLIMEDEAGSDLVDAWHAQDQEAWDAAWKRLTETEQRWSYFRSDLQRAAENEQGNQ